jgi:hypothetical protein
MTILRESANEMAGVRLNDKPHRGVRFQPEGGLGGRREMDLEAGAAIDVGDHQIVATCER